VRWNNKNQIFMINTYQFLTELDGNEFHHTIHAIDIESSVVKWVDELRRLQGYVYSFD